jgi:LysR family transcriptional activator of glutamate synthase operon
VELRQVKAFVGVARAGSFGKAAEELHVTRQGLSKQIGALEDELGVKLFMRGGGRRSVALTPAGEEFLPDAVTMVEASEAAQNRLKRLSGDDGGGQLRIVVVQGWESWPNWQGIASGFSDANPDLKLTITPGTTVEAMLDHVIHGESDVALFASRSVPRTGRVLRFHMLLTEPLVLALPPDHRLARRDQVAMSELRSDNWLLRPRHISISRDLITDAAAMSGFSPRVEHEYPTPTLVREQILAGQGIGALGLSESAFYAPAKIVGLGPPEVTYSVFLATRAARPTPAARAVIDFMTEFFPGAHEVKHPEEA